MKFSTLLNHAAELLRIVRKSSQPADYIASQYFRQKKYIGSKDRKFISECVFATLRMASISEYCCHCAFQRIKQAGEFTKYNTNLPLINSHKPDEIDLAVATCKISEIYDNFSFTGGFKISFKPSGSLPAILKDENFAFVDSLAEAYGELKDKLKPESLTFIIEIGDSFKKLNDEFLTLVKIEDNASRLTELIQNRFSFPSWLVEKLLENNNSVYDTAALAESFLNGAPLCLRVNTNIMPRDKAIGQLSEFSRDIEPSNLSPSGIIIGERLKIDSSPLYQSGVIEVQDEGSQIISYALAPEPGCSVLDACAGAGGKTLHLASMQNDTGRILATDVEFKRLKEISVRAGRSGFKSIETKLLKKGKSIGNKIFDYVLVDAPCSGLGTARRMPMAKWKLHPKLLEKLSARQSELLSIYSKYVKPGGILVYATCSVLPDENEKVVEKFLEENNSFEPDSLYLPFEKNIVKIAGLEKHDYMLTLWPSKHGCDGFFMARMRRKDSDEI